jgi:hypothetical protein
MGSLERLLSFYLQQHGQLRKVAQLLLTAAPRQIAQMDKAVKVEKDAVNTVRLQFQLLLT